LALKNSIIKKLMENTKEDFHIGNLSRFRESEADLLQYDPRNRINQLTLSEWIKHSNSFHILNEKIPKDQFKKQHPATFEEEYAFYYIEFLSKKGDIVLDPFMGTGTTNIVAVLSGRPCIGIELNKSFVEIAKKRFNLYQIEKNINYYFKGDCRRILDSIEFHEFIKNLDIDIQLTLTSPPFSNILKNYTSKKVDRSNLMTNYGNDIGNLEEIDDYEKFLQELCSIFKKIYAFTKNLGFLVILVQNFYRKKLFKNGRTGQQITFFAWDLASRLIKTRWIPCGEQIWCYPRKRLFPFGYPYTYLSNITHSYVLIFQKDINKK